MARSGIWRDRVPGPATDDSYQRRPCPQGTGSNWTTYRLPAGLRMDDASVTSFGDSPTSRRRTGQRSFAASKKLKRVRCWFGRTFRLVTGAVAGWVRAYRPHLQTGFMSLLLHLALALILALWVFPPGTASQIFSLLGTIAEEDAEITDGPLDFVQFQSLEDISTRDTVAESPDELNDPERAPIDADLLPTLTAPTDVLTVDVERVESVLASASGLQSLAEMGELGGRTVAGKRAALRKYGGTAASEAAVKAGLEWLKRIQQRDGSWKFSRPGRGAQPGRLRRTSMGATSMALLCYLGAGHTHKSSGPYRSTVRDGLEYLLRHAKASDGVIDLRGKYEDNAGMYVQGIATICLSEAHALEPRDLDLATAVKGGMAFIESTQDARGGGWRYEPRQPGDTSVTGWQVMAIHSARLGGVPVSRTTIQGIHTFLNSTQTDGGAGYQYIGRSGNATPSMTAVGLLCRMYLGWTRENEALQAGVAYLSAIGPSQNDIYYNYYATQVLHHWGGEEWTAWNNVLRDRLVDSQIKKGPATGSWAPGNQHGGRVGGQIFETTMALQTLEVYYRHLPIYREINEFPDATAHNKE